VALLFDSHSSYSTRGMLAFAATWLASSKALALLCGRGPLAAAPWTRAQFILLYALPLLPATPDPGSSSGRTSRNSKPKGNGSQPVADGGGGSTSLAASSAAKAALMAATLWAGVHAVNPLIRNLNYSLAMYGFLGEFPDRMALKWACISSLPAAVCSRLLPRTDSDREQGGRQRETVAAAAHLPLLPGALVRYLCPDMPTNPANISVQRVSSPARAALLLQACRWTA